MLSSGKRLLKEPLLQFFVLGTLLFLLYAAVAVPPDSIAPHRIVVTDVQIGVLAEQFRRTWLRPPTRTELQGMVDDFVKEEVLYREALALGLDRDDLVIRRRLRQKMEFLNSDLTAPPVPDVGELEAYLKEHAEEFRAQAELTFTQLFVAPGANADQRAVDLLTRLRAMGDPSEETGPLGDRTLLPRSMTAASEETIANTFGQEFAALLLDASVGEWSGPHISAYGLHIVYVSERDDSALPKLETVREAVERDWLIEKQRIADEAFYQALLERYVVEAELPAATATPAEGAQQQ